MPIKLITMGRMHLIYNFDKFGTDVKQSMVQKTGQLMCFLASARLTRSAVIVRSELCVHQVRIGGLVSSLCCCFEMSHAGSV